MEYFKIRKVLNFWRLFPAFFVIRSQPIARRELIIDEILFWKQCTSIVHTSIFDILAELLLAYPEYRNLLQYRLRYSGGGMLWLVERIVVKILFPAMETLYISTWEEAGRRLFIQHGFATMISAKKIGSNCHINQQVTIGFSKGAEPPTIGDNVSIFCGAKVLGQICVGNNVEIAANAVVVKNVESNVLVAGVPAKVIRHLDISG